MDARSRTGPCRHLGLPARLESNSRSRMDNRFADAIVRLRDFPEIGSAGIISGTRELIPHQNYRVVYQLDSDAVWILALVHTSRQWPPTER